MVCVQSMVGNNKLLVLFEDGKKKEIGYYPPVYLIEKEEVDMEESITLFLEIEEGEPLTINGDPPDGEPCMFVKGMYLYVFYCLCYDTDLTTDYSEEHVVEERYPDLDDMEDIRFDKIQEERRKATIRRRFMR